MTHEWVAGASWGPGGICLRESSLLSGNSLALLFQILLWAVLKYFPWTKKEQQQMLPVGSGMIEL